MKRRLIIIGGNNYNSVDTLYELDKMEDNNLIYTFHFLYIFTIKRQVGRALGLEFEVTYPSDQKL